MRNDLKAAIDFVEELRISYLETSSIKLSNPDWLYSLAKHDDRRNMFDTALTALRGPQPDPITGLMPCGCGGVAISEDYFGDDDVESSYRAFVSCEKCELRTSDYPRLFDAKEVWNTAMGWKGGAE